MLGSTHFGEAEEPSIQSLFKPKLIPFFFPNAFSGFLGQNSGEFSNRLIRENIFPSQLGSWQQLGRRFQQTEFSR
jgi:hypothetical protein